MNLQALTLKAINAQRGKFALTKTEHKEALLVKVALHNWVRGGKPASFQIRKFEDWGRIVCYVTPKDDEGMQFMTCVRLSDEMRWPEVDINDELFQMNEAHGG